MYLKVLSSRLPGFWYMCSHFLFCKYSMLIPAWHFAHSFEHSWYSAFSHFHKGNQNSLWFFWNKVVGMVNTILSTALFSGYFNSISAVSIWADASYNELNVTWRESFTIRVWGSRFKRWEVSIKNLRNTGLEILNRLKSKGQGCQYEMDSMEVKFNGKIFRASLSKCNYILQKSSIICFQNTLADVLSYLEFMSSTSPFGNITTLQIFVEYFLASIFNIYIVLNEGLSIVIQVHVSFNMRNCKRNWYSA